jgi:hypothetical protein
MRIRSSLITAILLCAGAAALPAQQDVKAVWGSGPTDIWALTQQPAVLHYDGRGWSQTPLAGMGTPLAIWGSGPRDVFVVGESGLAIRWDGSQWNRLTTGVTRDLVAVHGRSATEVYVLAQSENDNSPPLLLRWDGRQFTSSPLTLPFRAHALTVTPAEIIVAGAAFFDPTPNERRTYGVVARMRGAAWTLAGFDGRRATDPVLSGATWRRACVAGAAVTIVGQRDDGTLVVLVQRAGGWSPVAAPTLPANAHTDEATWVLAQDCTPLFLFQEGFARYARGQWQVVAPGLAATGQISGQDEMQRLAQEMQAAVAAGRMPTQEQIMRLQQLQQGAMGQVQAVQSAAAASQHFAFGSEPSGWGMTGADFWVGTSGGRVVHVTGDNARIEFDAMCVQPGMAAMPQCQGMQAGTAAAPATTAPQPRRPPGKRRP